MMARAQAALARTLEHVSHSTANYWIVMVWDLAAAAALLTVGWAAFWRGLPAAIAIAAAGFTSWGPLEYGLHRWVLHGAFPLPARTHARHHGSPETLISTPVFVISLGAMLILALVSTVLAIGDAALLVGGLYTGYNYFAIIHHLQHHHENELRKIPYFRRRCRLHDIHHSMPDVNFGISTTIWDRLLGTFEPNRDAPRTYFFSSTIKSYRTRLTRRPRATSCE